MTGLEALKQVKNFLGYNYCSVDLPDELATIEKSLKALEIIKEKKVDIKLLKASSTVEQLGRWFAEREFLTIEEFELLRSVLEWAD